ncbi:MAG: hypothetical protein N4A37_11165 [Prolixibacteraceae bacterium]|jgi:hypothetical protein|nr:hypothetical protein [Prolixibacteraceae bacterium]
MTDNNSINTANENSKTKVYLVKKSIANRHLIIGYVMLAIGMVAANFLHDLWILTTSWIYLFFAHWYRNRKTIILFEKYIELQRAPGRSTKQIKYKDITKIRDISDEKVIIHYSNGKKTRIPVGLISYDERRDLLNRLHQVMAA